MNQSEEKIRPVVLLADDDRITRLVIRAGLEKFGFKVLEAENGLQAVSIFLETGADMVLLDVIMPEMDGYEACRTLRSLAGLEHLPILMITGRDDRDSIKNAFEAGATDFAMKPINALILGHRVRYMLRAGLISKKNTALLNAIPDMMLQVRRDGTVIDYKEPKNSNTAASIMNPLGKKLVEQPFFAESAQILMRHIENALETGVAQICEHRSQTEAPPRSYESRIVVSGKDEVLAITRDVTERKAAEEQIIQLAYFDTLTGLLNRHAFKQNLSNILKEAKRYSRIVGLAFLDIDRFKRINDTFGHDVGDLLLKDVAARIIGSIRQSDLTARMSPDDVADSVARQGGDEFTVLLTQINSVEDAGKVAHRMLSALNLPFMVAGHEICITSSMGLSIYPHDGADAETLLKNADAAMYHAKDKGRNNYQFYTRSMNSRAFERLALESNLRRALEREEFMLCYQPQVAIGSGEMVGAESLIRWRHPDLGLVLPDQFIPVAEETGMIIKIGEWVLHTACAQLEAWQAEGLDKIRITVNVSSHQFRQGDLIGNVVKALEQFRLKPSSLELELTESAIMHDPEQAASILAKLKGMGVRVAMDDFGVGYSSLNYLKSFPLDILKIDRSFVRNIATDREDAAITTAIIAVAHALNIEVIAEGVETQEQLNFLREKGCDEIQGFFFSPAVPADVLGPMISRNDNLYCRAAVKEGKAGLQVPCPAGQIH